MANSKPSTSNFKLDTYSTALVLIPPIDIQIRVNNLRNGNDKAFPRWTSHFTLLFPFVAAHDLPSAVDHLRSAFDDAQLSPFQVTLNHVDKFSQKNYDTLYLAPCTESEKSFQTTWNVISKAFKYRGRPFVPHMTLGQANKDPSSISFLKDKGLRLLERPLSWSASSVVILRKDDKDQGLMKVYAEVPFSISGPSSEKIEIAPISPSIYHLQSGYWIRNMSDLTVDSDSDKLTLATYNVMHDPAYPTTKRLPALLSVIASASADILCLQEVTDEALPMLLTSEQIMGRYQFCSRNPSDAMENSRNIVVLSRGGLPFSWDSVPIGGNRKPASVLHFRYKSGRSLALAIIHLTAGHHQAQESKKILEHQALLQHLGTHYPNAETVIAGDCNLLDSARLPDNSGIDVWRATSSNTDPREGATFDPVDNHLASATARSDLSPKRYDRIWLLNKDETNGLRAVSSRVVGKDVDGASDHYLFLAEFQWRNDPSPSKDVYRTETSFLAHSVLSDQNLEEYCSAKGLVPDTDDLTAREVAIQEIQRCLELVSALPSENQPTTSKNSALKLIVQPVGSFALGVHTPSSDVDITVVGNIPPYTFWSLIQERAASRPLIEVRRFVKDARVQVLSLAVNGVKVEIQYCCAPRLAERWSELESLAPEDSLFLLSAQSLRTLNAHRDVVSLLLTIPLHQLLSFRLAHRALRDLCCSRGIWGNRFGYLGSFHLTIMLARELLVQFGTNAVSAMDLVRSFLKTYSSWDWTASEVEVPDVTHGVYRRNDKEPMVILSINRPIVNVSASVTHSTLSAISSEFSRAFTQLQSDTPWNHICDGVGKTPVGDFLTHSLAYIRIEVNHWGRNAQQGSSLVGYVESRLIMLLIELRRVAPQRAPRLWPSKFVQQGHESSSTTSVAFFIALDGELPAAALSVLRSFEEKLRGMERYYDPSVSYVSVTQVGVAEISQYGYILDSTSIEDVFGDDSDSSDLEDAYFSGDSDDKDDGKPQERVQIPLHPTWDPETFAFSQTLSKRQHKLAAKKKDTTSYIAAPKLRTSVDVFNRLMWDPKAGDKGDFIIGYEDRFKGLQEMALNAWKREVEDKEFIPFHRVVYFKRKSDGAILWDKRTKTDMVFGSGASASIPHSED